MTMGTMIEGSEFGFAQLGTPTTSLRPEPVVRPRWRWRERTRTAVRRLAPMSLRCSRCCQTRRLPYGRRTLSGPAMTRTVGVLGWRRSSP